MTFWNERVSNGVRYSTVAKIPVDRPPTVSIDEKRKLWFDSDTEIRIDNTSGSYAYGDEMQIIAESKTCPKIKRRSEAASGEYFRIELAYIPLESSLDFLGSLYLKQKQYLAEKLVQRTTSVRVIDRNMPISALLE